MSALPDFLISSYKTGLIVRPDKSEYKHHSSVSQDEAEDIYQKVLLLKPKNTLEIGFCLGYSGLAILNALEENDQGHHWAIDPFQQSLANGIGLENVERTGLKHRLTLFEDFPENVTHRLPNVQFAFIDASHIFDLTILDFVIADKKLDIGGLVGFHDMWMPSLRKAVRYILRNRPYEILAEYIQPPSRQSMNQKALSLLIKRVNSVYSKRNFLNQDISSSTNEYYSGNMVFLRKLDQDKRDWREYADF